MFGHGWTLPTKFVTTYLTFSWRISASKKIKITDTLLPQILSKNPVVWLDESILAIYWPYRIFPYIGFAQENRGTAISFISGYFQQKVMTKFYEKWKNLHFSPFCRFQGILGDFRELRKQEFFWRISFYHFSVFRFLLLCRVSEKLRKKLRDRLVKEVQSEGYKDKQEFTGPPLPAKRIQRKARIHWTSTASKKEWFMQKSDEHKLRRSFLLFVVQLPLFLSSITWQILITLENTLLINNI